MPVIRTTATRLAAPATLLAQSTMLAALPPDVHDTFVASTGPEADADASFRALLGAMGSGGNGFKL